VNGIRAGGGPAEGPPHNWRSATEVRARSVDLLR
jgi:hypothetical protein